MGVEGPEKPKSPWADGERFEKEAGEKAVREIRAEFEKKRKLALVAQEHPKLASAIENFVEALEFHQQVHEVFYTDQDGKIIGGTLTTLRKRPRGKNLGIGTPSLLGCSVRLKARDKSSKGGTADDIRLAALEVQKIYPEVAVSVEENREKKSIFCEYSFDRTKSAQ